MKTGRAGGGEFDAVALHIIGLHPNTRHEPSPQELFITVGQRLSYPVVQCDGYEQESNPSKLAAAASAAVLRTSWYRSTSSVAIPPCGTNSGAMGPNAV